ncbi:MAG: L-threonylcarbamoyladenylate synthase [Chloroflexota bacterium]|nr:L-threonylcarbamoyladenylate synthase [Chloroflexota bacterium]
MTPVRPTQILAPDAPGIARAAAIIRAGGLVAFPTETVYGLGAHALDARAVAGIFEAKGRPPDDPLIVHVLRAQDLPLVAEPSRYLEALARFWPGPLTVVLPRRPHVPDTVTGGLATVAVRVPSHSIARALLAAADVPIAAPSANLFSRPSPTLAEHVLEDLAGRIDAVLDGGPTPVGVESTIVDLSTEPPRLLRPGGVAAEELEAALSAPLRSAPSGGPVRAPGLLPTHYAPRTPLVLIGGPPDLARARLAAEISMALEHGQRVGVLLLSDDRELASDEVAVELVGSWSEPATSARRLFDALRALDRRGLDLLLARELAPQVGLGRALSDRLRRAASSVIAV